MSRGFCRSRAFRGQLREQVPGPVRYLGRATNVPCSERPIANSAHASADEPGSSLQPVRVFVAT